MKRRKEGEWSTMRHTIPGLEWPVLSSPYLIADVQESSIVNKGMNELITKVRQVQKYPNQRTVARKKYSQFC